MAGPTAVLREFVAQRQREKLLRGSVAEEDPLMDNVSVERVLGFIGSLEASHGDDTTVPMALVNVMKAYYMRGSLGQVCKVGLELVEGAACEEFAKALGLDSVEELRARAAEATSATKRTTSAPKRATRPPKRAHVEDVWRLDGDERLGTYFAFEGSVARVEAWTRREGRKHFRGTLLLGPRRGHLVEVSDTRLDELGHGSLDDQLEKVPNFRELEGADVPPVAAAAERVAIGDLFPDDWAKAFGGLFWAQDRAREAPWPAVVVDPRTLADDKLRERARRLVGSKHVVRFLGLSARANLGFCAYLTPYAEGPPAAGSNTRFSKKYRANYDKALLEAKNFGRPPPEVGASVAVKWLGDETTYTCTVVRLPDGLLGLRSPDFGPNEPDTIPFDPVEDDWQLLEATPQT